MVTAFKLVAAATCILWAQGTALPKKTEVECASVRGSITEQGSIIDFSVFTGHHKVKLNTSGRVVYISSSSASPSRCNKWTIERAKCSRCSTWKDFSEFDAHTITCSGKRAPVVPAGEASEQALVDASVGDPAGRTGTGTPRITQFQLGAFLNGLGVLLLFLVLVFVGDSALVTYNKYKWFAVVFHVIVSLVVIDVAHQEASKSWAWAFGGWVLPCLLHAIIALWFSPMKWSWESGFHGHGDMKNAFPLWKQGRHRFGTANNSTLTTGDVLLDIPQSGPWITYCNTPSGAPDDYRSWVKSEKYIKLKDSELHEEKFTLAWIVDRTSSGFQRDIVCEQDDNTQNDKVTIWDSYTGLISVLSDTEKIKHFDKLVKNTYKPTSWTNKRQVGQKLKLSDFLDAVGLESMAS